jgi:hypothetical protein
MSATPISQKLILIRTPPDFVSCEAVVRRRARLSLPQLKAMSFEISRARGDTGQGAIRPNAGRGPVHSSIENVHLSGYRARKREFHFRTDDVVFRRGIVTSWPSLYGAVQLQSKAESFMSESIGQAYASHYVERKAPGIGVWRGQTAGSRYDPGRDSEEAIGDSVINTSTDHGRKHVHSVKPPLCDWWWRVTERIGRTLDGRTKEPESCGGQWRAKLFSMEKGITFEEFDLRETLCGYSGREWQQQANEKLLSCIDEHEQFVNQAKTIARRVPSDLCTSQMHLVMNRAEQTAPCLMPVWDSWASRTLQCEHSHSCSGPVS